MHRTGIIVTSAAAFFAIIALMVLAFSKKAETPLAGGPEPQATTTERQMATYANPEIGLQFAYPTGPEGFVLEEPTTADMTPNASPYLIKTIVLTQTADDERFRSNPPIGGEGPPTITIQIFKNAKKQFPTQWAIQNVNYSNYNLRTGSSTESVVGGANAIRYRADGLYTSDNIVVAHGDYVYVIHDFWITEDSALRRDFEPLLASVQFIPVPGEL